MRSLIFNLFIGFLLLTRFAASAQNVYTIAGRVTDESGSPLKSATVFISGSQKITACDGEGNFRFDHIDAGNYQLTVTMIGFATYSENVVVQTKSAEVDIKLKVKPTALAEVNVGHGKDHRDDYLKGFKELFLGKSKNGKACVLVNPQVINFTTKKGVLYADADDFLIIENQRLGYHIKYLLKSFGYNSVTGITLYSGNTSFEPMKGTPQMQADWDKNRMEAYRGSMMHFLRAVYNHDVLKEGFIINPIIGDVNAYSDKRVYYDARPLRFDTLVHAIDSSFVSLKFGRVMYTYDPRKAASTKTNSPYVIRKLKTLDNSVTIIKLFSPQAVIDRTGAHQHFTDFLIEGKLAYDRVGDQLPFEYQPPAKN